MEAQEKQRQVKDENFYSIFGWMTNPKKMGLSGLELQLFAIIYGFCQNQPLNGYYASTNYLAEFTGATDRGVRKALDGLIKKGYLIRETQEAYHTYKYIAIVPDFDETPSKQGSDTQEPSASSSELSSSSPELSSSSPELSSSSPELSSSSPEQSSSSPELSSSSPELSSNNNIYINNNISNNKINKNDGSSFCSFADAPDVKLTISELFYLQKYYGQKMTTTYIKRLQASITKTGHNYSNPLDTIEKWIYEDNPKMGEADETV